MKRILPALLLLPLALACSDDTDSSGGGNSSGQSGGSGTGGSTPDGGSGGTGGTGGTETGGTGGATGGTGGTGGATGGTGGTGATGGAGGTGGTGGAGQAGNAGAGGAAGLPIDDFTSTAAASICNALFRCCGAQDIENYFFSYANDQILIDAGYADKLPPKANLADEAACTTIVKEMLDIVPFGDWIAQAKSGNVTYHGDVAQTCADTLDAAACGSAVANALHDPACFGFSAPVGPAQRSTFARTMGPGDPGCVPLRDGTGARFFGICDPLVAFCCYENPSSPGACAFPFDANGVARTGACKAVSEEGEACSGGVSNVQLCMTGLDCDFDNSVCVAPGTDLLSVGDDCVDDSFNILGQCQDSFCDMLGDGKCVARKADGADCIFADECESGACENSVCGPSTYCMGP
jgi:hypothetical protein